MKGQKSSYSGSGERYTNANRSLTTGIGREGMESHSQVGAERGGKHHFSRREDVTQLYIQQILYIFVMTKDTFF